MSTVITIIICAVLVILARTAQLCLKRTRELKKEFNLLYESYVELYERLLELEKGKEK